jgi:glucokinase
MLDYFLGVDLGGTKILTAVSDGKGNIKARVKLPTQAEEGQERVLNNIVLSIEKVLQEAGLSKKDIVRIGIGSPGPLNTREGIIYENANLPWKNVPIVKLMEDLTGIPVLLENDANAAALGEKWFGAGREADDMLYVTISTGIGGGIIINRQIYHGINDVAGEVGHIIIDPEGPLCGCGRRGCFEALASGTAVNRMGREAVKNQQDTVLKELSGNNPDNINGGMIAEAARMGDKVAQEIWNKAGYYLGIGLTNLLHILNPPLLVLGGGAMKAGDLIIKPMKESLEQFAYESVINSTEIRLAELGDDVGVKGAIAVAIGDRLLTSGGQV